MHVIAEKTWFWRGAFLTPGLEYDLPTDEAQRLIDVGAVRRTSAAGTAASAPTASTLAKYAQRGRNSVKA